MANARPDSRILRQGNRMNWFGAIALDSPGRGMDSKFFSM